jgi:hypothetical protein
MCLACSSAVCLPCLARLPRAHLCACLRHALPLLLSDSVLAPRAFWLALLRCAAADAGTEGCGGARLRPEAAVRWGPPPLLLLPATIYLCSVSASRMHLTSASLTLTSPRCRPAAARWLTRRAAIALLCPPVLPPPPYCLQTSP